MQQNKRREMAELINRIAASIRDYPNMGGDITIMTEVDKLVKETKIAEAEWFKSQAVANIWGDGNLCVSLSEIRNRIAALKAEGTKEKYHAG